MLGGFGDFEGAMLGKPSVVTPGRCAVCGRFANNAHHVIEKGMGGVGRSEQRIPTVTLCGSGTTGCHGKVHQRKLHLYWCEPMGGWVFHETPQPKNDFQDWIEDHALYRPLPGWVALKAGVRVFGRRS